MKFPVEGGTSQGSFLVSSSKVVEVERDYGSSSKNAEQHNKGRLEEGVLGLKVLSDPEGVNGASRCIGSFVESMASSVPPLALSSKLDMVEENNDGAMANSW